MCGRFTVLDGSLISGVDCGLGCDFAGLSEVILSGNEGYLVMEKMFEVDCFGSLLLWLFFAL